MNFTIAYASTSLDAMQIVRQGNPPIRRKYEPRSTRTSGLNRLVQTAENHRRIAALVRRHTLPDRLFCLVAIYCQPGEFSAICSSIWVPVTSATSYAGCAPQKLCYG